MKTFQDFSAAGVNQADFISRYIVEHAASIEVKTAFDANEYDAHRNVGIKRFYDAVNAANNVMRDSKAAPMACNYFNRLNTQRCTYSLGNGVEFEQEGTKDKLGNDFDTRLKDLAYLALIHGLCFGFWNMDRLIVFPVTEFAPLWDEETGALRAGIRYWRLSPDKPLYAVLYEEDGYSKFKSDGANSDLKLYEPKRAYKQRVLSVANGEYIIGEQNYGSLPIVPMWGNKHKQSTLIGMRGQIDNYDLILSGFADNVQDAAEIYWLVENYGGMSQNDCEKYLERLKVQHIANIDTSTGGKLSSYQQNVPTEAREKLLDRLHSQIYEDFGGLDVHSVEAGSTNDHLMAAYQPMDENADDFEYQIITFVQQLLKVAGLAEDTPVFKRNRISNITEEINAVILEAPYLDDRTILEKLPNISTDEVEKIIAAKEGENSARFEPDNEPDEDIEEEEEG